MQVGEEEKLMGDSGACAPGNGVSGLTIGVLGKSKGVPRSSDPMLKSSQKDIPAGTIGPSRE